MDDQEKAELEKLDGVPEWQRIIMQIVKEVMAEAKVEKGKQPGQRLINVTAGQGEPSWQSKLMRLVENAIAEVEAEKVAGREPLTAAETRLNKNQTQRYSDE